MRKEEGRRKKIVKSDLRASSGVRRSRAARFYQKRRLAKKPDLNMGRDSNATGSPGEINKAVAQRHANFATDPFG